MPSTVSREISTPALHDALPIFGILPYALSSGSRFCENGIHEARVCARQSVVVAACRRGRWTVRSGHEADRLQSRHSADLFGDLLRSEEHTAELQSLRHLVCRLLSAARYPLLPYTTLFRSSVSYPTLFRPAAVSARMGFMKRGFVLGSLLSLLLADVAAGQSGPVTKPIDFNRDIRPIFSETC